MTRPTTRREFLKESAAMAAAVAALRTADVRAAASPAGELPTIKLGTRTDREQSMQDKVRSVERRLSET